LLSVVNLPAFANRQTQLKEKDNLAGGNAVEPADACNQL